MKAIHSLKSDRMRPFMESAGGPYIIKPAIEIMALSAVTIRRHFDEFVLVTDDAGMHMARECRMPYTDIVSVGDRFGSDPSFWIHSKLHAYKEAKAPFVHFDTDLFLWEPLPATFLQSDVFAFHSETFMWSRYEQYREGLEASGLSLPKLHEKFRTSRMPVNMAIFGGQDHESIAHYAGYVLEYLEDHDGFNGATDAQKQALDSGIAFLEQLWASYLIQDVRQVRMEFLLTEQQVLRNDPVPGVAVTHLHGAKQQAMKSGKMDELMAKVQYKLRELDPEVYSAVQHYTDPAVDVDALIKENRRDQDLPG